MDCDFVPYVPRSIESATGQPDYAIAIRYIGSQRSGSAVLSGTTLTLKHGVGIGSNVADTSVGSSGALDMSLTAYNTYGKLVDAINLSANWAAKLIAVRRSTATLAAGAATFTLAAEAECKKPASGLYTSGVEDADFWGGLALRKNAKLNSIGLLVSNMNLEGATDSGRRNEVTYIRAQVAGFASAGLEFQIIARNLATGLERVAYQQQAVWGVGGVTNWGGSSATALAGGVGPIVGLSSEPGEELLLLWSEAAGDGVTDGAFTDLQIGSGWYPQGNVVRPFKHWKADA